MPLSQLNKANIQLGGVTERLNVPVLKTGEGATLPWVRIPPPPPYTLKSYIYLANPIFY